MLPLCFGCLFVVCVNSADFHFVFVIACSVLRVIDMSVFSVCGLLIWSGLLTCLILCLFAWCCFISLLVCYGFVVCVILWV